MMTNKEQKKYFKTILKYLKKEELKVSIELLEIFVQKNNLGQYNTDIEVIDNSYSSLLDYFIKGSEDKERQKYFNQLKDDILSLTFKITNKARNNLKNNSYSIRKSNINVNISLLQEMLEDRMEWTPENTENIIEYTLFLDEFKTWNKDIFEQFLNGESIPNYYKGLWVSVFTLNCIKEFQWEKFEYLGQLLTHERIEINQRAWVGIFLIMLLHNDIMPYYSKRIKETISPLVSDEEVSLLLLQFIRSQDTERIEKHINKDILPNMMEQNSFIREKLSELEEEELDENPDWEGIFKDSPEIMDKLQEISEMQLEGNDTFLSAFRHLKHFPFFHRVSNWLMPFSANHPDLKEIEEETPEFKELMFEKLEKSFHICNSDKYSLLFNLKNMPEAQKKMMLTMFKAELNSVEDIAKDKQLFDTNAERKHLTTQYMQDLYRFFELSPWKNEFKNIFKSDILLFQTTFSDIFLKENPETRKIIELYFVNKSFQNVIDGFEILNDSPQQIIFEKLAFSYQHLGNYAKAIENYQKAELFDSKNNWNQKKTAYCQRRAGRTEEALISYQDLVEQEPENTKLLSSLGYCYLELEKYDEALLCFENILKIETENTKVLRPISWCYFNNKQTKKAKEFLDQISLQDFTRHDYINLGHIEFVTGNKILAKTYYLKSIAKSNQERKEFYKSYERDTSLLLSYSISKQDILLMQESLRYS